MNLTAYLHKMIPTPCNQRPFVCDGFPETCTVIVLGENPATSMNTDWWTFWTDKSGFDLAKFEAAYAQSRVVAGKKSATSNTRLRLNRLRQRGLQCLETNVFSNERLQGRGSAAVATDLMPLFLANLPKLRGVISHGVIAEAYLSRLTLPDGVEKHVMKHFRSESYKNIDAVAAKLL